MQTGDGYVAVGSVATQSNSPDSPARKRKPEMSGYSTCPWRPAFAEVTHYDIPILRVQIERDYKGVAPVTAKSSAFREADASQTFRHRVHAGRGRRRASSSRRGSSPSGSPILDLELGPGSDRAPQVSVAWLNALRPRPSWKPKTFRK